MGLHETELGGVKAWGADPEDAECFAALTFRGGWADETLPTAGRTHLVEHLAMFGAGRTRHASNAFVDDRSCVFHATGTPEEVGRFLTGVAGALRALPVERFRDELNVLRVEDARSSVSLWERLMRHRFGPRGPGLAWFRAFGLDEVEPEALQAFTTRRFVRENAALWFTGPAPVGVELDLPAGTRLPPLVVEPLPRLELPAHHADGTGGVAVSSLPPRSPAMIAAVAAARSRARAVLREELGASYEVTSSYDRLDASTAHTLLQADCLDADGTRCRDRLLSVIEGLAADGFTPEEHAEHLEAVEAGAAEPSWAREAAIAVDDELYEERSPSREEVVEDVRALDADAIREAARLLAESAIVIVPEGTAMPKRGRLKPWGAWEAPPVTDGETFLRARVRLRRPSGRIVLGDDGVTLEEDGEQFTVRFAELAIALRLPEDGLELLSHEEVAVRVRPGVWEDGGRLLAEVRSRLAPGMELDSPSLVRTRRVEAAVGEMRSTRLVGTEVARLADLLDDAEELELVERAHRKLQFGLLAVTSTRLLYLYDEDVSEYAFGTIGELGTKGGKLRVALEDEELAVEADAERRERFAERLRAHAEGATREPGELF